VQIIERDFQRLLDNNRNLKQMAFNWETLVGGSGLKAAALLPKGTVNIVDSLLSETGMCGSQITITDGLAAVALRSPCGVNQGPTTNTGLISGSAVSCEPGTTRWATLETGEDGR
jgi:hypothetical protein